MTPVLGTYTCFRYIIYQVNIQPCDLFTVPLEITKQ